MVGEQDNIMPATKKRNYFKIKKLVFPILSLLLLVISGSLWFYWFQWMPFQARIECNKEAIGRARRAFRDSVELPAGEPSELERLFIEKGHFLKADYELYYNICLHGQGLN